MKRERVTLVGAGLAGSLLAIYLARRGFEVDVYERRPDMRRKPAGAGRSINLALSARGIRALKDVGLYDDVMKVAIPMRGRMIHLPGAAPQLQRYGKDDSEVIYAISRALLNIELMNKAETFPNVRIHFNQRCTGMNFGTGEVHLHNEQTGKESSVHTSTVIGTDGSASAVRSDMLKTGGFKLSQNYLEYGYKELSIPSGSGGALLMEKHALHIWPRGTYMLIALPNVDGSFTCTFFFPLEGDLSFKSLSTREKVYQFFQKQFPDAVALMPDFLDDYFSNPTGTMLTIKCSPWHIGGKAALLGDAVHAIVPFFGQGMNCAFEDCTYLDKLLSNRMKPTESWENLWKEIFREYEQERKVNTDAIADLAIENFVEMRDLVATPRFQLQKKIEAALQAKFPDTFIPKYAMVTFHRFPYSVALQRGRIQDRILEELSADAASSDAIDWNKARMMIERDLKHLTLPEET